MESENKMIRDFKFETNKQKLLTVWLKHKKLIIYSLLTLALISILLGIFSLYTQNQSKKYSAILHQAAIDQENGNIKKSTEALKNIYETTSVPSGVKGIASLKYGQNLLDLEKYNEAIKVYITTNKNNRFDNYVREYAGLMALKILVALNKENDKEKINLLIKNLEKNSKILQYYVMEQKAIFNWSGGNFREANIIFESLAGNPEVSEVLKKRAQQMHSFYVSKFGSKTDNKDIN